VRDLPRRTVTAVVYAAAVLLAATAPPFVFWLLLVVVAALGVSELLALRTGRPSLAFGTLFLVGLASLGTLREIGPLGARHGLADDLPVWLLLTILPTWSADVVAYVVGSTVGRRRLAPRISPGKTWEGTLAGFGAAALVALGLAAGFGLPRVPTALCVIGLGPIGLVGDLLESYVKRRAGVKDSGTILPGHGGVLDRLDSLVAAATFVLLIVAGQSASQLGAGAGELAIARF
jgi:phosphatidate cytidylyltransferase